QLQDLLCLDNHARINTPATLGGNWQWRVDAKLLTGALALEIADLTRMYGRAPEAPKKRKR
ncbi:MAG: 4-alpha-glucanotransferase, partial [Ruthenibacterium sp.]